MLRLDDDQYFEQRSIEHCQLGDVYRDVTLAYSTLPAGFEDRAGRRVRPDRAVEAVVATRNARWVVVCSYTCGFLAQPPGTRGYSHPYRLVAEVCPIREIVGSAGVPPDQARRDIVGRGGVQGLMYMPLPEPNEVHDEWKGAGVILIYMASLVTQPLLDGSMRVARMTADAQRILMARLMQTVGPYMPEPNDPALAPDLTDGWAARQT